MLCDGHHPGRGCRAAGRAAAAGSAVSGWKQVGAPKRYNSSNLFDLVDGEAQAMMGYSFAGPRRTASTRPAGQSKPVLTIDVYDMTDPLNAFGLFSSDRISGKPVAIGAEGVQDRHQRAELLEGALRRPDRHLSVNPATQAALLASRGPRRRKSPARARRPPLVQALPPGASPAARST